MTEKDFIYAYPCTIVADRYGGTYSGASWLAIHLEHWDDAFQNVLDAIDSCDPECMDFWNSDLPNDYIIGKGETPDSAVEDMLSKIRAMNNE